MEKRSVFDFAIYVMKKHLNGRKIAILEPDNQCFNILNKYGISEYDIITFDRNNANDKIKSLDEYKECNKEYYILIPVVFRNINYLQKLNDLGLRETEDFFFVNGSKRYVTEEMYTNVQPGDIMNFLAVVTAGRVHFILITLEEIATHIINKKIRFYILHSPDARGEIGKLIHDASCYSDIEIFAYEVAEREECKNLINLCDPRFSWPPEVFYKFIAYKYLPKDVDRVLYVDTGDVMITGNIDSFYWDDFDGNTFLVQHEWENSGEKVNEEIVLYDEADLYGGDVGVVRKILNGVTNTGVILMNLYKMRQDGYTLEDYSLFISKLYKMYGKEKIPFAFIDQSLLSTFYIGKIKYYRLNELQDFWFNPYNFVLYFYDLNSHVEPYYTTPIVHFTGMKTPKPWLVKYHIFFDHFQQRESFLCDVKEITYSMREYYYQWMFYAQKVEGRFAMRKKLASSPYLLSYCSEVEFSFDPNIWERQYILGRTVLVTKKPEPGNPAALPLRERLKKGKRYSLEARFKVKTASEWINFHIQDSRSRKYQVVCFRNTIDCNNRWIAFRKEFVPDYDNYDTLMFDASQVKGVDSFLAIDYLCVVEEN